MKLRSEYMSLVLAFCRKGYIGRQKFGRIIKQIRRIHGREQAHLFRGWVIMTTPITDAEYRLAA